MEITFKNNKLEKSFTDDNLLSKIYGTMAKKVKQRYEDLKLADNLFVISQYPAMRLHPYKGNSGIWSVDIIKNWYNPLVMYQYCEYLYAQFLKRKTQSVHS